MHQASTPDIATYNNINNHDQEFQNNIAGYNS